MVTAYDRGRTGPLYASNSPTGSETSTQKEQREKAASAPRRTSLAPGQGGRLRRSNHKEFPEEVSDEDEDEDESERQSLVMGEGHSERRKRMREDKLEKRALEKASGMSTELLKKQLEKMAEGAGLLKPPVPDVPAPPHDWPRETRRVPAALLLPSPPTLIDRCLSSSMGRILTFFLTLACFCIAAIMLMIWREPERRAIGELWTPGAALLSTITMYTLLPNLARRSGMAPSEQGADWKPYLCIYRCSYICSIPALLCLGLGYGAKAAFGTLSDVRTISELEPISPKYFNRVVDGYVALNLTKGISETRTFIDHGQNSTARRSRFRDAELRINREPFADVPEPTVPPGFLKLIRVAPIFADWKECVTKYRISQVCLDANPVVGWAVAETQSLCTDLGMVSCLPPEAVIEPVYMCSSVNPVFGIEEKGPVRALCGRVRRPPRAEVLDELQAILLIEGWKFEHLANISQAVWVDVQHDSCIDSPSECLVAWDLTASLGFIFASLTVISIVISCVVDACVDDRIRRARQVQKRKASRVKKTLVM